jgi:5''/3''-nucleotidase SurE
MSSTLRILVTNDDSCAAKGIEVLVRTMRQFGSVTVIAPEHPQSGMSMAVSLGGIPIAFKPLPEKEGSRWYSLDATPASCVKFGIDIIYPPERPDVVICGINHGTNTATAANYSGTLGAAEEAALNGLLGVGVSLDTKDADADFSMVEEYFPEVFRMIFENRPERGGVFYNVNFPAPELGAPKGIRISHMGLGHWVEEFNDVPGTETEEGGKTYVMAGRFVDDTPSDDSLADHHLVEEGYITITPHNLDNCDHAEAARLRQIGFDRDIR